MGTSAEPVRLALRKLWSDHVIWTREYIVAAVAGTPDAAAAAGRLLKNQEDIGAAIVGYYGEGAGAKLTELLKEHIMIAVDLVAAAKAGDQTAFATHDARWTANIGELAAFLAGANPNWPEKDVLDLLALHLKLTKDEAVARITGDWAADIRAFDDIFTEIMVVADTLHDGIVAQFPDRFPAQAG
ncbi:MAG: glycosyltransferase [Chloroflexota bacterium]